ncbi:MAG: SDR family oxidoreductase [Alphaproteobacteria bacterium]|nr:SDR family oxidoreductase [Alphaproteobacteria bacterium]
MPAEVPKVALVTGAAGGLGAAIAASLAAEGYRVALLDRDRDAVTAEARPLDHARPYVADITDETAVGATVQAIIDDFGAAPEVLVNNAGIVRFGDLLSHSVTDFRKVLDVNLVGTFIMSRVVGCRMQARRAGAIVNITSLNAFAVSPDAGAYPASKSAVATLTEQFALVLGPYGIRVNAVAPGFIDAGMSKPIYVDPAARQVRSASVPLGRLGAAQDVADLVVFLASDRASYIHGQHILVDGGIARSLKNHLPRKPPTPTR